MMPNDEEYRERYREHFGEDPPTSEQYQRQQEKERYEPVVSAAVSTILDSRLEVKVVDFDIPFWGMVALLIKVTLAAIPALIIITFWFFIVALLFGIVTTALFAG